MIFLWMENNCLSSTSEKHLGVVEEHRPNVSCKNQGRAQRYTNSIVVFQLVFLEEAKEKETLIQEKA